jgi:hypothetical protein
LHLICERKTESAKKKFNNAGIKALCTLALIVPNSVDVSPSNALLFIAAHPVLLAIYDISSFLNKEDISIFF